MDAAATLEAPRPKFRFTSENARLFSVKAVARRLQLSAQRKAIVERVRSGETTTEQAARLAEILHGIEQDLLHTRDPDNRNKLASAYDKLFARWQVLTGTPNPGSRRSKQGRPQAPVAVPMEPTNPPQNPPAV